MFDIRLPRGCPKSECEMQYLNETVFVDSKRKRNHLLTSSLQIHTSSRQLPHCSDSLRSLSSVDLLLLQPPVSRPSLISPLGHFSWRLGQSQNGFLQPSSSICFPPICIELAEGHEGGPYTKPPCRSRPFTEPVANTAQGRHIIGGI